MDSIRPPAVPLVTHHPYFSVWSPADALTDAEPVHWTGATNGLAGFARVDGEPYRFAGTDGDAPAMDQLDLTVRPTTTAYTFRAGGVELVVEFTSPLLLSDLDVLARPATYVTVSSHSIDGEPHDVRLYLDVTAEWCVDRPDQTVVTDRVDVPDAGQALRAGTDEQAVLAEAGDDTRIDWGYLYLLPPSGADRAIASASARTAFVDDGQVPADASGGPRPVGDDPPVLACSFDLGVDSDGECTEFVTIAYDELEAIEYFGEALAPYWRREGTDAPAMLADAVAEYAALRERCAAFDADLVAACREAGGEAYADVTAMAYRQAIAAHALVEADGEVLFVSKECFSNACSATVDVTYPSTPLFLLYAPELVEGMLRPVFRYARSEAWPYEFAPHDVGTYPAVNGQAYSREDGELYREDQMPVEECGNVLITTAAVCLAEDDPAFAQAEWDLLTQWVEYLLDHGYDPGEQLCTDDFAGHLAHNANLSLKTIVAVASYGLLCGLRGDDASRREYLDRAREMAAGWTADADDGGHYRLAFDRPGSWSLKYNLVWDELFDLDLFEDDVREAEVETYLAECNEYGTPLDSRAAYTKADWLVWAATLGDDEQFATLVEPLWRFLDETPDRVPFTDWYDTDTGEQITYDHSETDDRVGFQHRSVVGGVFVKLLADRSPFR